MAVTLVDDGNEVVDVSRKLVFGISTKDLEEWDAWLEVASRHSLYLY